MKQPTVTYEEIVDWLENQPRYFEITGTEKGVIVVATHKCAAVRLLYAKTGRRPGPLVLLADLAYALEVGESWIEAAITAEWDYDEMLFRCGEQDRHREVLNLDAE